MAPDGHPRVGIGVFVFKSREDRRFLLGLRKGSIGAGKSIFQLSSITFNNLIIGTWSLAGGHLEHGETFEQCSIREVAEETGIEIEDVRFLTAVESFFAEEDKHYVTIFMTAFAKQSQDGGVVEAQVGLILLYMSYSSLD